jgi:hypothetical protein
MAKLYEGHNVEFWLFEAKGTFAITQREHCIFIPGPTEGARELLELLNSNPPHDDETEYTVGGNLRVTFLEDGSVLIWDTDEYQHVTIPIYAFSALLECLEKFLDRTT